MININKLYDVNSLDFGMHVCIGSGATGSVFLGKDNDGRFLAVKFITKFSDIIEKRNYIREISTMSNLKHPCVLPFVGFSFQSGVNFNNFGDFPCIVTDYIEGGSLDKLLEKMYQSTEPLPNWGPTEKSIAVYGIVAGMAYIHLRSIVHRDLKPANIFLNKNNEATISDFGLAKYADISSIYMTQGIGSPMFMAPEIIDPVDDDETNQFMKPGKHSDVYAFSVTLLSFFVLPKWNTKKRIVTYPDIKKAILEGTRFVIPDTVPEDTRGLISSCWGKADNRPTFAFIQNSMREGKYLFTGTDVGRFNEYVTKIDGMVNPRPKSTPSTPSTTRHSFMGD